MGKGSALLPRWAAKWYARTITDVKKPGTLLTLGAFVLGLMLAWAAFMWWTVNGIAAMDTLDGEPPGPLHGYGVTAILALPGLGLIVFGVRRFVLGESDHESGDA